MIMKAFRWFAINGTFALCLYFGLNGNDGMLRIGLFIAWFTILTIPLLLTDLAAAEMAKTKPSVPLWLNYAFDVSIIAVFVYYGYVITGVFYVFYLFSIIIVREKARAINEKEEGQEEGQRHERR